MLRIWKDLFKFDDIEEDSNFFDLGGDSLIAGRLQRAIANECGARLRTADILQHPTLAGLTDWLTSAGEKSRREEFLAANPSVIPVQPFGEGTPVFVISESMIFRKLALGLGKDQPVYTLQMGEDPAAPSPSASFKEITGYYMRLVREVQPTGPYRLAGWCVSGWIAYGVARRLEEQGEAIELLTVIDAAAPGFWEQSWQRKLSKNFIYGWHRFKLARRTMPPWQLISKMLARKKVTPETILADKLDDQQDKMASHAQFSGRLRGKLLLFCSEDEPIGSLLPPGLGWEQMLGRPISAISLPGNHHEIFNPPGAKIMAAHILRELRGTNRSRVLS